MSLSLIRFSTARAIRLDLANLYITQFPWENQEKNAADPLPGFGANKAAASRFRAVHWREQKPPVYDLRNYRSLVIRQFSPAMRLPITQTAGVSNATQIGSGRV